MLPSLGRTFAISYCHSLRWDLALGITGCLHSAPETLTSGVRRGPYLRLWKFETEETAERLTAMELEEIQRHRYPMQIQSGRKKVTIDADCALCRLLAASLTAPGPVPSVTRSIFGSTRSVKDQVKHVYDLEIDVSGALPVLPLAADARLLGNHPANYALCPDTANASRERILGWLRRCSDEHTECQSMERQVLERRCGPKDC